MRQGMTAFVQTLIGFLNDPGDIALAARIEQTSVSETRRARNTHLTAQGARAFDQQGFCAASRRGYCRRDARSASSAYNNIV
jgi:hypothetical protein